MLKKFYETDTMANFIKPLGVIYADISIVPSVLTQVKVLGA
jgi:hypothetical protein